MNTEGRTIIRPRRGRALKRCIAVLVLLCVLFVAGSEIATSVVFAKMFARTSVCGIDPGEDCRIVTFDCGENTLQGYLYENTDAPGIVMVCHGMKSCALRHGDEIRYFYDAGWTVFALDGTGVCASEGSGTMGIQQMRYDATAALAWIDAQQELTDLPVIVYGHSAGAYAAAMLSVNDAVAASVCLASYDSPGGTMLYWAEKQAGILAKIEAPFLYSRLRRVFGVEWNYNAGALVSDTNKPILILQGTADSIVPEEISLYAHAAGSGNENITCRLMDGRGHSNLWRSGDQLDMETMDGIDAFMRAAIRETV